VSEPLLEVVRGLIERTYRLRTGLTEIGPFVIGDAGYRLFYATGTGERAIGSAEGGEAKTLVREGTDGVTACIYFPDAMIRHLESHPPLRGIGEENVGAFATFVEEIDHLLLIAERSLGRRPVSLFELELHANVSKYLVLARFLAGRTGRLGEDGRRWLRHRLFPGVEFCDEDQAVRERYHDAERWAVRLLDGLDGLDGLHRAERLEVLRQFHLAEPGAKLRLISTLGRSRLPD